MLLTSSTPLPLLTGGGTDPLAGGVEQPAGSGFQPLLAGLVRPLGTAPATAAAQAAPVDALANGGGAGKPLPPDGAALPLMPPLAGTGTTATPMMGEPAAGEPAAGDPAAGALVAHEMAMTELAAVTAETGTPLATSPEVDPLAVGLPVTAAAVTAELEAGSEPAVEATAPLAADLPGQPPDSATTANAGPAATETVAEHEPSQVDAGVGLLFSPVTPPPVATAANAAPMPVVEGAVKRMLPVAGKVAAAAVAEPSAANGEALGASGSPTEPRGAVAVPPVALAETLAEVDTGAIDDAISTTTPGSAAPPVRESGARVYQGLVTAQTQVDVPVGKPGWSSAVVDKLMWFSAQQISSAEIHLNPADLGPLSVRIATHQEQATVYFTSHHAAVREALDQALPRLREMFESQGMQLLDAGVGDQQARQQTSARRDMAGGGDGPQRGGEDGAGGESATQQLGARLPLGLVDAYA
jgi:flagellar hook-length control protein FliK